MLNDLGYFGTYSFDTQSLTVWYALFHCFWVRRFIVQEITAITWFSVDSCAQCSIFIFI